MKKRTVTINLNVLVMIMVMSMLAIGGYNLGQKSEKNRRKAYARNMADAQIYSSKMKAMNLGSLPLDQMVFAKVKDMINEF